MPLDWRHPPHVPTEMDSHSHLVGAGERPATKMQTKKELMGRLGCIYIYLDWPNVVSNTELWKSRGEAFAQQWEIIG